MKKTILFLLITAIALTGCMQPQNRILIPKSNIQDMVDTKFPYDKNAFVTRLKFQEPLIEFRDTDIKLNLAYSGYFMDKQINGHFDFVGRLDYKPEKGTLVITGMDLLNMDVNDAEFPYEEKLRAIAPKMIEQYLKKHPVYTLNPEDFNKDLVDLQLKDVKVQGDNLSILISP